MENRKLKENVDGDEIRQVKVYSLTEDRKWEERGLGHITIDYMEKSDNLALFVFDKVSHEIILLHRISTHDIYQKQGKLISWKDPEYSSELALSFDEVSQCSYIWDHICNVQRSSHFDGKLHGINSELRELPTVALSTLSLILKIVVESGVMDQMRVTELISHDLDFFWKLMDLFRTCEDLENLDSLHTIFKIVKGIIMLNSPQIFEKIFGDEFVMDIIGCLEYDPQVPRVQHRDFFTEHVVFKEAIPIKDPAVLSKIHQTYRIGYIKDVVLPRVLDDATTATLTSIIHANNGVVVSLLKEDTTFIQELFLRLRSLSTSAESRKNLVCFLLEFCTLSKSLQAVHQQRLFRDLVNEGLFNIISDILQSEDMRLVLIGTDILILFLNHDPNILRSYIVRPEGTLLLSRLVQGMLTDFGDDMHCQFLEILRTLLDSYTLSGSQRDTIVEIFYEKHLGQLVDVITCSCSGMSNTLAKAAAGDSVKYSGTRPEILLNICELLCFCVLHHPYRIKCYFLLNNMMDKVLALTRRKEKYLVVAAVRFMRTVISRNDENLSNYIAKRNLLKPIVDAFVANGDRYNLLNSAVLDLFEFIRKENLKPLLKYLVESFWSQLGKFESITSIQSLKIKYEQSLESIGTKSAVNIDSRNCPEERVLEKEEEAYFNEDSDEEDAASAFVARTRRVQSHPSSSNGCSPSSSPLSSRPGQLVNFKDDEDDEDYKPPPKRQTNASEEDALESLTLKRKLVRKETRVTKKRLDNKISISKGGVFAALCSTLSQAVLPNKKAAAIAQIASHTSSSKRSTDKDNHQDKEVVKRQHEENNSSSEENDTEKKGVSQNCPNILSKTQEHGQQPEEQENLRLPAFPSKEMAVNGS